MRRFVLWGWLGLLTVLIPFSSRSTASDEPHASETTVADVGSAPNFNRSVRPILAKRCFTCHGPDSDAREADLRLDTFEDATRDLGGHQAIVPGKSEESEILLRIRSDDADLRMPPADKAEPLSPEEIQILSAWIDAGAGYQTHWTFVPPTRHPIPAIPASTPSEPSVTSLANWSRDGIDRWVARGMARNDLQPNREANRLTLVRRLYLDLVGLPPTPEQADHFVSDKSPMAYTRLVDSLLADPEYGQRFARPWLDMARYADTNGYEKDRPRSIWPYRDWVIKSLNEDMPFDQFTIEQIAGDMLANASVEQRIATGFHRNTMLNEEGGIDPLEFRFQAVVDRVATLGTVWMGLTVGCAQCHTHKYDPITHKDYYALMALLDNADEPEQIVPNRLWDQQRTQHELELQQLEQQLRAQFPDYEDWLVSQQADPVVWTTPQPTELHSTLPKLRWQEDGSVFADGDATKRDEYRLVYSEGVSVETKEPTPLPGSLVNQPITAVRLEVLPDERLPANGPGRSYYEGRRGDFFLSEFTILVDGTPVKLQAASHSHGSLSVGSGSTDAANVIDGDGSTGWSTSERPGQPHQWVANLAAPIAVDQPIEVQLLFERHFAASLGRFRVSFAAAESPQIASMVPTELKASLHQTSPITAELRDALFPYFLAATPATLEAHKSWLAKKRATPEATTTLVFRERQPDNPRPTLLRHRGEYLQPREEITGDIPAFLRSTTHADVEGRSSMNRLDLARWLVSGENPLVARVVVNRAWREFFGAGLVRTAGDYGTQSEPPQHPELLDMLAVDLKKNGWSVKQLHRRLVHSAVYRQSSQVDNTKHHADPENHWLSRGPRFRQSAEMIRDSFLAASGLLDRTIGGPSVYPQQSASVTAMAYGSPAWTTSAGGDAYRRSLYTYAKRTAPFAAYLVFDGPTGENCIDRRDRSNTPLQALTLLNDPMYVELAQELATDVLREHRKPDDIIQSIFRRLLTRPATASELAAIRTFYLDQQARVNAGEVSGETTSVWTWVARALMNLDEAITKE